MFLESVVNQLLRDTIRPAAAAVLCVLLLPAESSRAGSEIYTNAVRPLLAEKCVSCHGAVRQQSGLRLDAGSLILQGGDSGAVVVPGQPEESELLLRVTADDPDLRMPPEGDGEPLTREQTDLLTEWIRSGAAFPEDEPIPEGPSSHWAWQPVRRPAVPDVSDPDWSHPIDAFVFRSWQEHGIAPAAMADRRTLLRRASFDLIGLPPTREQMAALLNDRSDHAWERAVDRLLASPHHGERWARHWMDVWRYSDWDGYKMAVRGSQRHIWHWRDWIVRSLNADRGYDRMVTEMLAGDELAPEDPNVLAATGFLVRNYHNSNRNIWLDATVEHTAKAFLATTINCARCHDHKYDPIDQREYYAFRAIFEPHHVRTDRLPGQADLMQDGLPRAFDASPDAETYVYIRGNEKHPDKDHPVSPAVPVVLGGSYEPAEVWLPVFASWPSLRDFVVEEDLERAQQQVRAAEAKVATLTGADGAEASSGPAQEALHVARLKLASLQARLEADRGRAGLLPDSTPALQKAREQTALQKEQEYRVAAAELNVHRKQAGLEAARSIDTEPERKKAIQKAEKELSTAQKELEKVRQDAAKDDQKYTPTGKHYPARSTGRRTALARWIVSRNNPLTARVAVNDIWMWHFGAPLVENVFDFGMRTARPEHAELLDWLAAEFMEHGWSMKHLHRVILTSRVWRLSSEVTADSAEADPDGRFLSRARVQRIDAECVRDSILAVAGTLDRTMGGPVVPFREADESTRRSLYIEHAYEKQATMLVLFDAASPNECYRRSTSVIPQQALAMVNSDLTVRSARQAAERLSQEAADADRFIERAFLELLSRPPNPEEQAACREFLLQQTDELQPNRQAVSEAGSGSGQTDMSPEQRARRNLVHVLINHNDFITVR